MRWFIERTQDVCKTIGGGIFSRKAKKGEAVVAYRREALPTEDKAMCA
jgi:hypothetical protein